MARRLDGRSGEYEMNSYDVVIGANYGDEGKGHIVDFLSSKYDRCLVVRFNSGAQAGHTVEVDVGKRHVFHSFGSGTFAGADTLLSRYFVVHPYGFLTEQEELSEIGHRPKVFVDENCLVTTPYDQLINQAIENKRGEDRHGSCGIGFGETIERATQGYPLYVRDLSGWGMSGLHNKLYDIFKEYVPDRCAQLGIRIEEVDIHEWCRDAKEFYNRVTVIPNSNDMIDLHRNVIFEGAQGLALDQYSDGFPHVTRS